VVYLATDGTGGFAVKDEAAAGTNLRLVGDGSGYFR